MVRCPRCGAENKDDARFCIQCGTNLETGAYPYRLRERRRMEEECFGIPRGGQIAGIVFGMIIVLVGLALLFEINIWRMIGPMIAIIFGILIVIGALYRLRRM